MNRRVGGKVEGKKDGKTTGFSGGTKMTWMMMTPLNLSLQTARKRGMIGSG